ncbi:MAG: transporter [Candidatus Omnitrophota bacterium]
MKNFLLISAIILSFPSACFAVYPAASHHARTTGHHKKTVDVNYSYEYEKSYDSDEIIRTSEVDVALTYGVNPDLDIILDVPLVVKTKKIGDDYRGLDDVSLEMKWRFYERAGLHLALYPEITLPSGRYKDGVGNGRMTYSSMLIASQEIGRFQVSATAKYTFNDNQTGDRLNLWEVHLTPQAKLSEKVTALVSWGIERNSTKGRDNNPVHLSGGIIYAMTDFLAIIPTFKAMLNKPETDLTFIIGTSWSF